MIYPTPQGCTQAFLPLVTVAISNFAGLVWTENFWCIFGVKTPFFKFLRRFEVHFCRVDQCSFCFCIIYGSKRASLLVSLFSEVSFIVQLYFFPGTFLFHFLLFCCWTTPLFLSFSPRAEMNTSEAKKLRKLIYSVVKIFGSVRKFQFVPIVHRSIFFLKRNCYLKCSNYYALI